MGHEAGALPDGCDLHHLGLEPSAVTDAVLLRRRHGHALYRLVHGPRSYVLKWFAEPTEASEVHAYALLMRLGVPTLPLYGHAANLLLLEDLDASPTWRLATAADMERAATGVAVAAWYRALHAAGDVLMAEPCGPPVWLRREVDVLDSASIRRTGERLGLSAAPGWCLAVEQIEALRRATHAMPATFVYNDFHWTNLALSRQDPLRAIVFDYHLLGIGPRAADHRNVSSVLAGDALAALQSAYGPVDQCEAILDAPVATLHALQVAAERPHLPRWAVLLVHEVRAGVLETKLRRALAPL